MFSLCNNTMVPSLANLDRGNITQKDLILGNSTMGNLIFSYVVRHWGMIPWVIFLSDFTLGNLSRCSPTMGYNTMGNVMGLFTLGY